MAKHTGGKHVGINYTQCLYVRSRLHLVIINNEEQMIAGKKYKLHRLVTYV